MDGAPVVAVGGQWRNRRSDYQPCYADCNKYLFCLIFQHKLVPKMATITYDVLSLTLLKLVERISHTGWRRTGPQAYQRLRYQKHKK
jgi:hypothetical protein